MAWGRFGGIRPVLLRGAALCAALRLGGCAGVPIGGHSYVYVGIGVIHIEKEADATGIRATTLGLTAGCGQITIGAEASFCAVLPEHGSVAIIDRARSPNASLSVQQPQPRNQP